MQNRPVGLEKREYMQTPREPGLTGHWAILGAGDRIILLNVLVFVLWQLPPCRPFMTDHFLVSWSGVFEHGRVWTIVTAAFSHQDLWHLVWNMVYLHWFASELEQIYGRRNFVLLYLHGAIVSSLAHAAWAHGWGWDVPALGASGAVMAVVIVTAIFYPNRTISMMWFVPLPLWLLASFKLLGDFSGLFDHGSGIGHAAHLGGALAGAFFWWFDLRLFASPGQQEYLEKPWPTLRSVLARVFSRPRLSPAHEGAAVDARTQRVDEILRKITREGMPSLTPEELAFLRDAGNKRK